MNLNSTYLQSTRRDARQRGSAVVLAISTIVMMVLLGAAYLQIARTDRRTAASVDTRSQVDDASILRFIGRIIASDIPTNIRNGTVEYYDYPWTEEATNADQAMDTQMSVADREMMNLRVVDDRFAPTTVPGPEPDLNPGGNELPDAQAREPRASGPLADAAGNFYSAGSPIDDSWLASNRPVNMSGGQFWPHVTNLMGVFLDLGDLRADPATGTGMFPAQYLSTSNPTAPNRLQSGDTMEVPALPTASANPNLFADADGDGITDSRWTWAPLPSTAGLAYVMAVRIIDNSALLDINALSARRSDFGAEPPRWLWPGELDLESGLAEIRTNAGLAAADPTNLSAENILTSPSPQGRNVTGTPGFDTFSGRLYNWLEASALNTDNDVIDGWEFLGSSIEQDEAEDPMSTPLTAITADEAMDPNVDYNTYRVRQEETELRWRNGLNRANSDNSASAPATPLETLDDNYFRSPGATVESAFNDTPFTTPATFFNDEPRKQITTVSGSADYARVDVNEATRVRDFQGDQLNVTNHLNDLAEVFEDSLQGGNRPELFNRGGWGSPADFADQAAAILRDFTDDDSLITLRDGHYGMEYLPFISEVYIQARYISQGVTEFPVPEPNPRDEQAWQLVDNDYVVIVELVNPWPWPIELPDVDVVLRDETAATPTETSLGDLPTLSGAGGDDFLEPNEAVFIRLEGSAASGDNAGLVLDGSPTEFDSTSTTPWPLDTTTTSRLLTDIENLSIRLDALDNNGGRVGYQTFRVKKIPEAVIESYTSGQGPAPTPGSDGFLQISALGSANGLQALAVRDVDVADRGWADGPGFLASADNMIQANAALPLNDPGAVPPSIDPGSASTLGFALKEAMSPDLTDELDSRVMDARPESLVTSPANRSGDEPWVIGNAGRLYRSGDVLRMVLMGPRDVTGDGEVDPIAEVWHETFVNNSPASEYRIADMMLDLNDTANTVGNTDLTFAAYYLTVFETIQVSNDSDRGRVAGRPNINTMDPALLASILPQINTADSTALTGFIADVRDDPTDLGRPANERGIRYPAELLNTMTTAQRDLVFSPAAVATIADTNELDPHVGIGVAHNADGHIDDREEQSMLINYLNQVVSTRSDVFTVYVLVRAYPSDDFSNDGTNDPVDEFRLMAVFDRSRTNRDGFPRLLAVQRFQD